MKFTDSSRAITPQDITDVETLLGLKLPLPVRDYYRATNGGIPEPYVLETDHIDTVVTEFLPLKSEERDTAVASYQILVLDKQLVPNNLFPFAAEGGGDYFFFDTLTPDGAVYLYRHDTAKEHLVSVDVGFVEFWSLLKDET